MKELYTLDLSFNKLEGSIPSTFKNLGMMEFMFFTSNLLTGSVPQWMLDKGANIDLSYNNFMWGSPVSSECPSTDVNLFGSSSAGNTTAGGFPCSKNNYHCSRYFLPPKGGRATSMGAVIGTTAAILFLISLVVGILWKKCCLGGKMRDRDLTGLELQTGSFTLKQINAATDNFANCNKIGEGGFGSVYKGLLLDGTVIAVKRLSSKSSQGNREFLNEIGIISALRHPNLVKLYGCCIEGDQLFLVYEYMENNSLAHALFSLEKFQLHLDWPTRRKICIGIARGLAFLHDECRLKIVHRDIKATNILLDRDLSPKISDFGLAKLSEGEKTHISTRIAGTLGYMAPEYAMHGHLTNKADVYSFGIVALEIVSGKSIKNFIPEGDFINLVDWVHILKEKGALLELVDPKLGSEFNTEEVLSTLNVALLCTNASPTHRPTMSAVISMLEGRTAIQSSILITISSSYGLEFKASGNHYHQSPSQTSSTGSSQTLILSVDLGGISSSSSASADNLNQTE